MERNVYLGCGDVHVKEGAHVCYIFNDDDERKRTTTRFVESGLNDGENVLCLIDSMTTAEFGRCLSQVGIDLGSHAKSLFIEEALPFYCPGGEFSCAEMLKLLGNFYRDAISQGRSGARVTGEGSWALSKNKVEDLLMYEAKINQVLEKHPCTACCQYDARRFDGQMIMDVLSVHPMMIVHGQIVHNPFYIEPMTFLEQYAQRYKGGSDATA